MRKVLFSIIISLIFFVLPACKVFFTEDLRMQVEAQKIKLENIQYYTSKKIILQRISSSETVMEDTAKLKQTRQIELDRIKIKRNTKGVCVKNTEKTMEMIFEKNTKSTLKFVLSDTADVKSRFKIGALSWKNGIGEIAYDSTIYYLQAKNYFFQPNCKESSLKVKRRFMYKLKITKRKLKGVKVGE